VRECEGAEYSRSIMHSCKKNGKTRHGETIPNMGGEKKENGGVGEFNCDIL
jgi:hypothetical protein